MMMPAGYHPLSLYMSSEAFICQTLNQENTKRPKDILFCRALAL